MKRPDAWLTFRLSLQSDYHVGSGHRAGPLVDAALLRDHDSAPTIRGTTIAGLLKDGLCDLRDTEVVKRFKRSFEEAQVRLFGSPEHRKRWAFSSARPVGRVEGNAERWGAQGVTRVRINPRTRRSDSQKLFSEEEGDARLEFEFAATCTSATTQDTRDAFLLVAAARMVRHLGASRRRGRGECVISLHAAQGVPGLAGDGQLTDRALDEFQIQWLGENVTSTQASPRVQDKARTLSLKGARKRFRVMAYLEEPLIVARRSEAANAYETLLTIPGTTLLGALADGATTELDLQDGREPPKDFVALFFRGGVRVSGLLPAMRESNALYPVIPAPQALFACENFPAYSEVSAPHAAQNFADTIELPAQCSHNGCGAKLEPLDGFLALKRIPERFDPILREEAHIEVNSETGRAKTGRLFEYVALEAGQWFTGELDCANDACWNRLQELTGFAENTLLTLRLGKASRRGYGATKLVLQSLDDADASPWVQRPLPERLKDISQPITITLLTDAITCDEWGRFYGGFDEKWLANELGLQAGQIQLLGNFASTRSVDTFNAFRRLPRWRDEAIVAGSAAGFQINAKGLSLKAVLDKLAQIERDGIGLRCNEGFGRVAFNHPILDNPPHEDWTGIRFTPADFLPTPGSHPLETEMSFRREWIDTLKDGDWDVITKDFEPVARILFLSRNLPLDEVRMRLHQLGEPSAEYLWNKSIPAREKKSKLDPAGLTLITGFIDKLERRVNLSDHQRATALELLAERVAIQAAKKAKGVGQ